MGKIKQHLTTLRDFLNKSFKGATIGTAKCDDIIASIEELQKVVDIWHSPEELPVVEEGGQVKIVVCGGRENDFHQLRYFYNENELIGVAKWCYASDLLAQAGVVK